MRRRGLVGSYSNWPTEISPGAPGVASCPLGDVGPLILTCVRERTDLLDHLEPLSIVRAFSFWTTARPLLSGPKGVGFGRRPLCKQ